MPKLTPEQLKEKYLKLPQDLRDAIFSVDSADIIQNVGKKFNLAVDKVGELADETGLVMLGLTHPKDFIPNLASRLGTDKETARKIAEEINKRIFVKVRESLKEVHKIGEQDIKTEDVKKEREEILREIEKEEEPAQGEMEIPEIIKGPFEAKTKEKIFRMPKEESKYANGDPYREPLK